LASSTFTLWHKHQQLLRRMQIVVLVVLLHFCIEYNSTLR